MLNLCAQVALLLVRACAAISGVSTNLVMVAGLHRTKRLLDRSAQRQAERGTGGSVV
jgi:hypothetical protein